MSKQAEVFKTLGQLWTLCCPGYWMLQYVAPFYSSLYIPSVYTTLHSRDGVIWVLNCSQILPDITLRTTTEKFNFCLIKIFTSLSADSGEPRAQKTMQAPLSTALCDVTTCPAVEKCQRGNIDSILYGALIFSACHCWLPVHCSFTNYIFRYAHLFFLLQTAFQAQKKHRALRMVVLLCWLVGLKHFGHVRATKAFFTRE